MFTLAHKGSSNEEKIGTLMQLYGIRPGNIGATQKIETMEHAVQWLHQKMKTGEKYNKAQKVTVVAATLGGGALGSVGGPLLGAVGAGVGAAGGYATGKVARLGKFLYKTARGTQGVHRMQAAQILVHSAGDRMLGLGGEESQLAYDVLLMFYDQPVLDALLQYGAGDEEREKNMAASVAERFRS